MKNWREEITKELETQREAWADVVHNTLSESDMDVKCLGHGDLCKPFTLWTIKRVYFPATYDANEWVASVPRDPCDEVTKHVGG